MFTEQEDEFVGLAIFTLLRPPDFTTPEGASEYLTVTVMQHYAHAVPGLQEKVTETVAALVFGDS